ncbi:hypothetical protein CASFOL_036950 [Castilleja foliolosa]|uniref:CCHC-type domain-containing protein n=1 Tax=Castilleja foliolosa TaxID=1961234 RepID=A0ABD3BPI2_9LAMI
MKQGSAVIVLRLTPRSSSRLPTRRAELSLNQKKIFKVDDHICIAIVGLTMDGRVMSRYMPTRMALPFFISVTTSAGKQIDSRNNHGSSTLATNKNKFSDVARDVSRFATVALAGVDSEEIQVSADHTKWIGTFQSKQDFIDVVEVLHLALTIFSGLGKQTDFDVVDNLWLESSSWECCENPPTLSSSSRVGSIIELARLKTYVSGSSDSKLTILLVADVYMKTADKIAAAGFYVVVTDFFYGDPFDPANEVKPLLVWKSLHGPAKAFEDAKPVIEAKPLDVVFTPGQQDKCFICGQVGHLAAECKGKAKRKAGEFGEKCDADIVEEVEEPKKFGIYV